SRPYEVWARSSQAGRATARDCPYPSHPVPHHRGHRRRATVQAWHNDGCGRRMARGHPSRLPCSDGNITKEESACLNIILSCLIYEVELRLLSAVIAWPRRRPPRLPPVALM